MKVDILECGLLDTDPLNRAVWRAGVNPNRLLPTLVTGNDVAVYGNINADYIYI